MTDLFANLSTRFALGAAPTIRPRPKLRFEGSADTGSLLEEEQADPIIPTGPVESQRSDSPAPAQRIVENPPPVHRLRSENDAAVAKSRQETESPANAQPDQIEHPAHATLDAPSDLAPKREPKKTRSSQQDKTRSPDIGPSSVHPSSPPLVFADDNKNMDAVAPQSEPTAVSEPQVIETIQHIGTPQVTAPNDELPGEQTPQTTIRIGKIEVRQPQPAAPAPPASPPPRRPTTASKSTPTATASRGSSDSGLTSYLGWKRR